MSVKNKLHIQLLKKCGIENIKELRVKTQHRNDWLNNNFIFWYPFMGHFYMKNACWMYSFLFQYSVNRTHQSFFGITKIKN